MHVHTLTLAQTDVRMDGRYGVCACLHIHRLKHLCQHTNMEVRS